MGFCQETRVKGKEEKKGLRVYAKEYYKDSKLSTEENEDIRRVKAEKRWKDQKTTGSKDC